MFCQDAYIYIMILFTEFITKQHNSHCVIVALPAHHSNVCESNTFGSEANNHTMESLHRRCLEVRTEMLKVYPAQGVVVWSENICLRIIA